MTDLHKEKELLQRAQENYKYFDELYEYLVPHVYRFYRSADKVRYRLKEMNMYSVIPYPVLFSAIAKSGKSKEFLVPDAISKYSPIMTGSLTTIKTFITSNLGIAMIAGLVVITGVRIGTWAYTTHKPDSPEDKQTNSAQIDAPAPTNIAQTEVAPTTTIKNSPSPTQQVTPTPQDIYAGWKTYTSEQAGVSFRYPDGIAHIKESVTNLGPGPLSGQKTFMITIQEKAPT